MPKNPDFELPEMPDMNDLFGQLTDSLSGLEETLEEVQEVMEDLPEQMPQLGEIMSAFSNLGKGEAPDFGDLEDALGGFGEMQEELSQQISSEPDWEMESRIQIASLLEIQVSAVFNLQKVLQAYESTQNPDMDGAIEDVLKNIPDLDLGGGMQEMIKEQLKQGRGAARVQEVDVLRCSFAGAPPDAAEKLRLSPEANIPLSIKERQINFEFAPMLTIKNRWENADPPVFQPMAEQVRVNLEAFKTQNSFRKSFTFKQSGREISIKIQFSKL